MVCLATRILPKTGHLCACVCVRGHPRTCQAWIISKRCLFFPFPVWFLRQIDIINMYVVCMCCVGVCGSDCILCATYENSSACVVAAEKWTMAGNTVVTRAKVISRWPCETRQSEQRASHSQWLNLCYATPRRHGTTSNQVNCDWVWR